MQAPLHLSRILLCLAFGAANAAWAHPEYRLTVMGPANSSAAGINNDGVVIGTYPFSNTANHGFLNRGKDLVDLGTLGGSASAAVAINDKGQVLGHWISAAGQQRGFIYDAGKQRDIGVLPGRITYYTGINNDGYITAYGPLRDNYDNQRSFLRAPNGSLTDLGSLPYEKAITFAYALNNGNKVVGASGPLEFPEQPLRAFIWSKGTIRDLGDFGGFPNYAQAINDCGQVTGSMTVAGGFHTRIAFLYSKGRLTDIDGRPAAVERDSGGTGINRHGHIVGTSNHLSGFVYRGRRMESLNALIEPKARWNIRFPAAINDAGQIAATAERNGVQYAVRLDLIRAHLQRAPDPEPGDEQRQATQPVLLEQLASP